MMRVELSGRRGKKREATERVYGSGVVWWRKVEAGDVGWGEGEIGYTDDPLWHPREEAVEKNEYRILPTLPPCVQLYLSLLQ